MEFISIKLKKNFVDYLKILFLTLFSFFICYHYGFNGIVPLDDFVSYNCGYRILSGDIPFKDYYSVTGFFLCLIQSIFYKFFGTNWSSLVLHASVFNSLICLIFYYFLNRLKISNSFALFSCVSISILSYPNNGVPGADHHSWILSICSFMFFYLSLKEKNKIFAIISTFLLFFAFLVKQVPSTYFLILIFFLYIIYSIKDKKFHFFKELSLSILACFFLLLLYLKINSINFNDFFEQYIFLSLNLGSSRFENINLKFFLEKISSIYFVIFLIAPLFVNFYYYLLVKNKIKEEYFIINFIIIFSLILIGLIYEIHTNNSAISFMLLPLIVVFIFKIQKQIGQVRFLKYIYFILIFITWLKIFQFNYYISLINIIFIFILCFISYFKKINFLSNQNLLIIYLIFSTFYYFQTSVDARKYKDLNSDYKIFSFDGSRIDKKFANVRWSTSYRLVEKKEIESFKFKINLLKNLDEKFIIITDYQIFNSILKINDYSPVKYWHTGVSYPAKHSKYRIKFENFFKEKLIKNNVNYIIIDNNTSVFTEKIDDYEFLSKCSKIINQENTYNIKLLKLSRMCLESFSN
jgi:hypothetical protein